MQAADQAIFRHVGVEPAEQSILVLKSSVHFRADFQPIAEYGLVAAAPRALDQKVQRTPRPPKSWSGAIPMKSNQSLRSESTIVE